MSTSISYENVEKVFHGKNEVRALKDVSFTIEPGELFCLLGPSGCGKTTLLRCTAGLETLTSGKIFYGDTDVTNIPPFRRNIGMVFQNYALYPHMSVFENVAYGLRVRGLSAGEIKERVTEIMELVGLGEILDRNPSPKALSGGQQQRVAVARALVYDPTILLLDEPLANLDAKLRRYMRAEIRRIQKATNITTIFVTHDQEEAMAIGDRLAVMKDGYVKQIGSGEELYHNPQNLFVTGFIGEINFFAGTIAEKKDSSYTVQLNAANVVFTGTPRITCDEASDLAPGNEVVMAFRPENLVVQSSAEEAILSGRVQIIQNLGHVIRYTITIQENGEEKTIEADMSHKAEGIGEGDQVFVTFNVADGFLFPKGGEE